MAGWPVRFDGQTIAVKPAPLLGAHSAEVLKDWLGLNESQLLWQGPLTDGGPLGAWRRYLFAGQLPLAPVVTAAFPHGIARASFDVVSSRRLRPDAHIIRPVAIVTG